jgi:XRE family transcriptional regulator, regulator of sulfur utilization
MKRDHKPDKVGRLVRTIRQRRGLSLQEFSRLSGVPQSTLSFLEIGTRQGRNLTLETGAKLARALGISLDVLAGVYEEKDSEQLTAVAS